MAPETGIRSAGDDKTLAGILRLSTGYLQQRGVPSPRLEAELLLGHCLRLSRLQLYLEFERPLEEGELARLRELLRVRASGRPLAYIVGNREFLGRAFLVSESVLIPRPETEELVQLAIIRAAPMDHPASVLDLGCGSGCIGISIAAEVPESRVDLVDLEPEAVRLTRANAELLGLDQRCNAFEGSWAEPVLGRGPYQLVVSNPPYVTSSECLTLDRTVRDFEPRLALDGGLDGLAAYRSLLPALGTLMDRPSLVLLECDPRRIHEVAELCRRLWPDGQLTCHKDLSYRERILEVSLR